MGNSPSRNDLNSCNTSNNNNNNNNDGHNTSSSASASALTDDPDPLPIRSSKSKNINNNNNPKYKLSIPISTSYSSTSSNDELITNSYLTSTSTSTAFSSLSSNSKNNHNNNNNNKIKPSSKISPYLSSNADVYISSSSSPSTSPSSSTSNDLQFNLDLDSATTATKKLSLTSTTKSQPIKSAQNLKIKQPPPTNPIDIDSIIERLVASGLSKKSPKSFILSNSEIKFICAKSRRIFMSQPMLLELAAPVKIVGDIHGQFHDLLRIFKLCGFPPNSNYLFMGDYVDRGKQSLETMVLLLSLKIKYPENFFLLRGNHESADITKMYGFYDECKRRNSNGVKIWKLFVDVFNTLPVAATIADKIFCVHGGLSPDLKNLNQIKKIQRPTDIPDEGLLADLLWSDPQEKELSNSNSNSNSNVKDWKQNDRGVSYCFNERVVKKFCSNFDFDLIARGHMVVEEGYEFYGNRKLVTIFSAPNYCGEFKNWGAVMNVNKKLMCSFELLKPKEAKK